MLGGVIGGLLTAFVKWRRRVHHASLYIRPITGHDDYKERFAEAEKKLTAVGYDVINPAKINSYLPQLTYEEYMKVDMTYLSLCDAIYMLPGWRKSKGANREYGYALGAGKMIMEEG